MAHQDTVKNWFKTGLKPTQAQFWAKFSFLRWKDEKIPVADIEGIEDILNAKAEAAVLTHHLTDPNAHATEFNAKEDKNNRGFANGYAPLDEFRKIAAEFLTIVNDLTTGGSAAILSAEQGKVLQGKIDGINVILTSDDINLDTVQELVDAIKTVETSLETILVNDLTTGGVTKALTAEMGKSLKALVDGLALAKFDTANITNNIEFDKASTTKVPSAKEVYDFASGARVPLSAFIDSINGNDATAKIEVANRPFKTIEALLNALPITQSETTTIYVQSGNVIFTNQIEARNIKWVSYMGSVLDFSNIQSDFVFSVPPIYGASYTWEFTGFNISIISNYIGMRVFSRIAGVPVIIIKGYLETVNWKSRSETPDYASICLTDGSDFTVKKLYDSSLDTIVFESSGTVKINVDNMYVQYARQVLKSGLWKSEVIINNLIQVGTTSLAYDFYRGVISRTSLLTIKNVTFNVPGSLKPNALIMNFDGTYNDNVGINLQGTVEVKGKLISNTFPYLPFLGGSTGNTLKITDYNGNMGLISLYGVSNKVFITNSNIVVNESICRAMEPSNDDKVVVELNGFNTFRQVDSTKPLFDARTEFGPSIINIEDYGTTKTNAKTFGVRVNVVNKTTTFKEKLNEIVVRSKLDLVNKTLNSNFNYIVDGVLNDLLPSDRIIVPVGGLSLSGYGFDVSALKALQADSIIFSSPIGGSGNVFLSNISLEASGGNSKVFQVTNAGAPTGGADAIELNVVNFDNCDSLGELINFRQGLWNNVGVFGVKDGLTLSGTWSGGFRSDLTIVRNFGISGSISTLFKKGTDLLLKSRFWTDINADFKSSGSLSNFDVTNFSTTNLYQIKGAQITRGGVIDDTQNYTGSITAFDSVSDWQGNNGLKNSNLHPYGISTDKMKVCIDDADAATQGVLVRETYIENSTGYHKTRVS